MKKTCWKKDSHLGIKDLKRGSHLGKNDFGKRTRTWARKLFEKGLRLGKNNLFGEGVHTNLEKGNTNFIAI